MNTSRINKSKMFAPFLFNATKRTTCFLFIFYIVLFLVFVVGNYQQFLDSNLIYLIRISGFAAILCLVFSFLGMILSLMNAVICDRKKKYVLFSLIYFVVMATRVFFLVLLAFFDVLSSGV